MVKSYLEFTNDKELAIETLVELEEEYLFFEELHTIAVGSHTLFRYKDDSDGPRPESYREDYLTGEYFTTEDDKENFYSEMKAAAESGMDFTGRWFILPNGTNQGVLHDIKTRSIIPVELNAIIYQNALIIAELSNLAGDTVKAQEYNDRAKKILNAIEAVLWDESVGSWLDYDMINKKRRNFFSASNLSPLWLKAYNPEKEAAVTAKVLKYIANEGVDDYPGGVPNTLEHTGEQWDFPNVWAPMQVSLFQLVGLSNVIQ